MIGKKRRHWERTVGVTPGNLRLDDIGDRSGISPGRLQIWRRAMGDLTVNPKGKAISEAGDEIIGESTVRVMREELGEKRHRDRRDHTAREKVTTITED